MVVEKCPTCGTSGTEAMQDDLTDIMRALGIEVYARPISCHEVVQAEVLPAIRRLRGES